MDSDISIPFNSTHIQGTLHTSRKSETLIIICHGYTDTKDVPGIKKLSESLSTKYDVFRFTFTDGVPHLPTQSKNILTVLDAFRNRYKKIYVLGHSLGGLSVLLSTTHGCKCDGLILINPLVDIKKHIAWKYRRILILGLLSYPFVARIRENVHYYFRNLKPKKIAIPILIIVAKNDNILDSSHGIGLYSLVSSHRKKLIIGDHMSHGLDTQDAIRYVTHAITDWILKL